MNETDELHELAPPSEASSNDSYAKPSPSTTDDEAPAAHTEDQLPALYHHARNCYKAMLDDAREVQMFVEGIDQTTGMPPVYKAIVYEGFLTTLVKEQLNLSVPYYTSIRNLLLDMECVRQLRRGGGNTPSQWLMIREPTAACYWQKRPIGTLSSETTGEKRDKIIRSLQREVSELKQQYRDVLDFLEQQFGSTEVKE